jgi:hypothetical protein
MLVFISNTDRDTSALEIELARKVLGGGGGAMSRVHEKSKLL